MQLLMEKDQSVTTELPIAKRGCRAGKLLYFILLWFVFFIRVGAPPTKLDPVVPMAEGMQHGKDMQAIGERIKKALEQIVEESRKQTAYPLDQTSGLFSTSAEFPVSR